MTTTAALTWDVSLPHRALNATEYATHLEILRRLARCPGVTGMAHYEDLPAGIAMWIAVNWAGLVRTVRGPWDAHYLSQLGTIYLAQREGLHHSTGSLSISLPFEDS